MHRQFSRHVANAHNTQWHSAHNFALVGDKPVEPRASANFHPKHGMIMRFERLMDDETQDVTLPGT